MTHLLSTASLRSLVAPALRCLALGCAIVLGTLALGSPASAQGGGSTDYLIRLLAESDAFRVRVRAADALGTRGGEPGVQDALIAALRDENAAVRAAAAASLGRVGDAAAAAPLRALARDREGAVVSAAREAVTLIEGRTGGGSGTGTGSGSTGSSAAADDRYYVAVGVPSAVTGMSDAAYRRTSERIRGAVDGLAGVSLAPAGESAEAASRVLRSRSLTGFFLDFAVTLEDTPNGVRVTVGCTIQDYPGRNMRAATTGRATLTGLHDTAAPEVADAVGAAVTAALRNVPATLGTVRGGSGR
jgi:hypothetical protein